MHVYPAIDLRGGRVVRLRQGDYAQEKSYADDPVAQAKAFADAGATWLHMVDLDGARSGRMSHLDVIRRVCEQTGLKVQVGGGIREEAVIRQLFDCGVARAILGTAALANWLWFEGLMRDPTYHGRVVLGLDARGGKLAVQGWERSLEATALEVAGKVSDWPLAAIVYTDISTDGTMQGPNLEATRRITEVTRVPVIASGGVGTTEHLRALRGLAVAGVIVGRALYEGAFTLEQAIQIVERGA